MYYIQKQVFDRLEDITSNIHLDDLEPMYYKEDVYVDQYKPLKLILNIRGINNNKIAMKEGDIVFSETIPIEKLNDKSTLVEDILKTPINYLSKQHLNIRRLFGNRPPMFNISYLVKDLNSICIVFNILLENGLQKHFVDIGAEFLDIRDIDVREGTLCTLIKPTIQIINGGITNDTDKNTKER